MELSGDRFARSGFWLGDPRAGLVFDFYSDDVLRKQESTNTLAFRFRVWLFRSDGQHHCDRFLDREHGCNALLHRQARFAGRGRVCGGLSHPLTVESEGPA